MFLRQLCDQHTALTEDGIQCLEAVEKNLSLIAELTNSDVFIDIFDDTNQRAIVAAQACPRHSKSLYGFSVVGMTASREDEPAVYHAFERNVAVRDLRAVTQEGCAVRQVVVPICFEGQPIGVLIREKDISSSLLQDRKYNAIAQELLEAKRTVKTWQKQNELLNKKESSAVRSAQVASAEATIQEANHRIKNSLQLVASILNIQARGASQPEIRGILEENMNRVLAIASIHDLISKEGLGGSVSLLPLIEQLIHQLTLLIPPGNDISILLEGDDVIIPIEIASSVILVVNELITNAIQHAFIGQAKGTIRVIVYSGSLYTSIIVSDDGKGFEGDADKKSQHLGLQIARRTVQDKLHGELHITASANGTQAIFDFKMPINK